MSPWDVHQVAWLAQGLMSEGKLCAELFTSCEIRAIGEGLFDLMQFHVYSAVILLKDSIYQEAVYHDISRGIFHSGNLSMVPIPNAGDQQS